ncbi:MAG: substrate-binding domain-containing protein [Pseudomonadota bacterium]
MFSCLHRLTCWALLGCWLPLTAAADGSAHLRIGGTGAVDALLSRLALEYRRIDPAARIEVVRPPLGSSAGIRATSQGYLGVAFSGRPLTASEAQELSERELTRTPFAFVVNGEVGRENLTQQDLLDIHAGLRQHWDDGAPLRLVMRPLSDSDSAYLRSLSPVLDHAVIAALDRPGMVLANTDVDNAEMLGRAKGMFGTMTLCQLRSQGLALKPLAFDGVLPTPEALASGRYPLFKTLHVVTRRDPPPAASRFVDFLFSAAGRRVISENGCAAATAKR